MLTYLSQLDDYVYTRVYRYVYNYVLISLLDDYHHVREFVDNFYSTGSHYKLYTLIGNTEIQRRLCIFYEQQITNGKMRRGSDHLKGVIHDHIYQITTLLTYNGLEQQPLDQDRFGLIFQARGGHLPPIVKHFIGILLQLKHR